MIRCPLTKTAMINLIKAGAFDEVETSLADRRQIMAYYLSLVSEPKKRLTLQNFNGLIQHDLLPKELELQVRVFNFTKYLKAYIDKGARLLLSEFKYSNSNFYKHLINLDKGI